MKTLLSRLFAPGTNSVAANLGLFALRVWLGATIAANHGWDKLIHFQEKAGSFPDVLHIGSGAANLALSVFAEFFCGVLLVAGLATRFAALVLAINLAVAFLLVHKLALSGPHSGELAFIYLAGFCALLLAGPGRLSADARLFGKSRS